MGVLEQINKVNSDMHTIDIHGKKYAMVHDRIKAFRKVFPEGRIDTSVIKCEGDMCIVTAKVYNEEGSMLGSGTAQEAQGTSTINKTSYVENCETSAIGRALGVAGFGLLDSIASADEMKNAAREQLLIGKDATAREQLIAYCDKKGIDLWEVRDKFGVLPGMNDEIVKAKFEMIKAEYGE